MKSEKMLTTSELTALKNSELSNTKYYDERLGRFTWELLKGGSLGKWEI